MMATLATILQTALTESVEHKQALPAEFYNSEEFLQLELVKLFQGGWICLGRCDEVPAVGDYFTATLLDEPVIVVRSRSNSIDVLANVCRHRGMPLVDGRGNVSKFRCKYHAWTYNLDGTLRNAPLMRNPRSGSRQTGEKTQAIKLIKNKAAKAHDIHAETPPSECRLPVIQSFCWGGFIFGSLSPVAEGKEPASTTCARDGDVNRHTSYDLSELQADVGAYHMEDMALIDSFEEIWDCNWKSLVENFMDAYHLSVVHPQTLRTLTPTNLCRKLSSGKHHTSYIANYADTAPPRENHHPDLSAEQCRQSRLFCVYPSMVASVSADTLAFFALQPKGLDRVSVKWGLASFEQDLSDLEKQVRIDKWRAINDEDHAILRRLQIGLRSSYYQGGSLAPENFEGCVSDFHRALITSLLN